MSLKVNDDGTVTVTMSRRAYVYTGAVVADSIPTGPLSAEWRESAIADLALYTEQGMALAKDGVDTLLASNQHKPTGKAN